MDSTPADLKKWPTNIYSQIAVALKGGELREPGLANLASRLAVRGPREPITHTSASGSQRNIMATFRKFCSAQASQKSNQLGRNVSAGSVQP
eukprot:5576177-Prymnesium_polylepis.2